LIEIMSIGFISIGEVARDDQRTLYFASVQQMFPTRINKKKLSLCAKSLSQF